MEFLSASLQNIPAPKFLYHFEAHRAFLWLDLVFATELQGNFPGGNFFQFIRRRADILQFIFRNCSRGADEVVRMFHATRFPWWGGVDGVRVMN